MKFNPVLLPVGAVLIWSLNTLVSKMAAGVIDPAAISFYRWLIAGVLMTPFMLRPLWRQRSTVLRHLPKLAVLGLLGMVMYQCLAYVAAQHTSATNMGLLAAMMPLMAIVLSMLLLGETPTTGSLAGGIVSLAGLALLLGKGHPATLLANGVQVGDAMMLLACLAYAAYGVLLKRWALPLTRWQSLFVQIWCANVILFVYYLYRHAPPLTSAGLPLVLFAAIPASIAAPLMWMAGVNRLGPSRTTALMNLLPLATVILAQLILGESLQPWHWLGGAVVLTGVILAQHMTRPLRLRSGLVASEG
jgi:drug/metabolite transporter (DMT)-like permease